jgi:hypothetical protein
MECLPWVFRCAVFQDYINAPGLWRPDAEVRLVRPDYFGANRVATLDLANFSRVVEHGSSKMRALASEATKEQYGLDRAGRTVSEYAS